jgi:hypothetical protein
MGVKSFGALLATFSGLAPNTRYLGRVDYDDGTAVLGRTLLSIRTP